MALSRSPRQRVSVNELRGLGSTLGDLPRSEGRLRSGYRTRTEGIDNLEIWEQFRRH